MEDTDLRKVKNFRDSLLGIFFFFVSTKIDPSASQLWGKVQAEHWISVELLICLSFLY